MGTDIKTAYFKGSDGTYRPVLWTLPKDVILPSFLIEEEENENDLEINEEEGENYLIDDVELYPGLSSAHLKRFYTSIKGMIELPKSLNHLEIFIARILGGRVTRQDLLDLIKRDKLIDYNRVVIWGGFRNRPLVELFLEVTPPWYKKEIAKEFLLQYATKNLSSDDDTSKPGDFTCQACRKSYDDFAMLVNHLERTIAEITYMCRHCGYMKFMNICALIYHVFDDQYIGPCFEYCVVCNSRVSLLSYHLSGLSTYTDCWRAECTTCPFVAYSKCSYKIHLAAHTSQLPYICPECGKFFLLKRDLEKHEDEVCFIYRKHRLYLCSSCCLMFSEEEHFTVHVISSHYKRSLQCIICRQLLSSQADFLSHRALYHPDSASSYHIVHNCDLCPSKTFRGVSLLKHISQHKADMQCSIMLYWCHCEFYTRHKDTFRKHIKSKRCKPAKFNRPQILKICNKCEDVKTYNFTEPVFTCEDCAVEMSNTKNKMLYYCEMCQMVLQFSWDAVSDHFFFSHKNCDRFSVAHNVTIITSDQISNVQPGNFIERKCISYTTFEDMMKVAKGDSGTKPNAVEGNSDSLSKCLADINMQDEGRIKGIRVKSPESINASLVKASMENRSATLPNSQDFNEPGTTKWIFPRHISSTQVFTCKKCYFTTCLKEDMSEHMIRKHDKTLLQCDPCGIGFLNADERQHHYKTIHECDLEPRASVVKNKKELDDEERLNPRVSDDMDFESIMRIIC